MAGSTFQPPIHLDPNQDPGQQTAFINQNFQSLAVALESNTFKIISSGTVTIPAASTDAAGGSNQISRVSVTHNLGFVPICLAYYIDQYTGAYTQLPAFYVYQGEQTLPAPYGYVMPLNEYINAQTTTSTVTFYNSFTNTHDAGAYSATAKTVKYYLLQETAN